MTVASRSGRSLAHALACGLVAGCAGTTVTLTPSPQAPLCDRNAIALVFWAPQWRPDQKDVAQREAAADAGMRRFLAESGCFAGAELRRVPTLDAAALSTRSGTAIGHVSRVVTVGIRELGPTVSLLSSAALIDGGTEVVLQIGEIAVPDAVLRRAFAVHWRHGGPGVVKGVASLADDMRAALSAGLQPEPRAE